MPTKNKVMETKKEILMTADTIKVPLKIYTDASFDHRFDVGATSTYCPEWSLRYESIYSGRKEVPREDFKGCEIEILHDIKGSTEMELLAASNATYVARSIKEIEPDATFIIHIDNMSVYEFFNKSPLSYITYIKVRGHPGRNDHDFCSHFEVVDKRSNTLCKKLRKLLYGV